MISAIAAVILPVIGSAIASLLFYPTLLLIEITKFFTDLPGSNLAIGKISLTIVITIYGLLLLVWFSKWWQARWHLVFLFSATLIILPIVYIHFNLVQVTILAAKTEQIIVIQDRGQVILINSGKADTAKYTVLPFLKEQGINNIDRGIALDNSSSFSDGWSQIASNLKIKNLSINSTLKSIIEIDLAKNQLLLNKEKIVINSTEIDSSAPRLPLLKLQIKDSTWLIVGNWSKKIDVEKYLQKSQLNFTPQIFLFSGKKIEPEWLKIWQPKIAIASTTKLEENSQKLLQTKQTELYVTEKDGAIIWKPKTGFKTFLDRN